MACQNLVGFGSEMTTPSRILLASSSVYRRELLDRLLPSFDCESPGIDETRIDAEAPIELATRLADLKARAGAAAHPGHIVIGADQVPALNGEILRKPVAESQARRAAERQAAEEAEARRKEVVARHQAEERVEQEAEARRKAEGEKTKAEQLNREMAAEIERLRAQLGGHEEGEA